MLDNNINQNKLSNRMFGSLVIFLNSSAFSILSATYGGLDKEKTSVDVTERLQEIMREQGGSLTLNKGSKTKLFGNPTFGHASTVIKKKQLLVVYSVNGNVKRKIFGDLDPVHLDYTS